MRSCRSGRAWASRSIKTTSRIWSGRKSQDQAYTTKIVLREEVMKTTRREFAIGTAAAAAASALPFARPAIAQSEPIRIGWLAALTGPSSAPAIGFDRGVKYAAETINAAGGVKGRKIETRHARHAGRSDQGGERHAGNDQPGQGARDLGPDQFRRVARGHADHDARENAEHPSLRDRQPDRRREISVCVPPLAFQYAMGRRSAQICPARS